MDENKITYYPTLCKVSIRAAITQIENIIYYSSNEDLDNPSNPYEKQLIEYLNSFDLELDPFLKLKKINIYLHNSQLWENLEEIDTLKGFLMLIDKKEHPQKVYNDGNKICACCEGYSDTFIYYNKFIIVKTESEDRFRGTYTMGCSYSITHKENIYSPITYEQLKSFFSIKNLSALTKSKIRQTLANNHEININTVIGELPIPSRLIEFLKNV